MMLGSVEHNRMLLEMGKALRETNRGIINPQIPSLSLNDLRPAMELVARARAEYLKGLLELSKVQKGLPTDDEIEQLHKLRYTYEELVAGVQAMETAIERGYLDIT